MVTVNGSNVEFRFYRPQASQVWLVGDFSDWRDGVIPMRRLPDGYWQASLLLEPGLFRFRYQADGQWFTDYAAFGIEQGRYGPDSVIRVAVGAA